MMRSLFPIVTNNDLVFPDNFVNHFFGDFMKPFDSSYSVPKVDVEDKENEYVLTTDLPLIRYSLRSPFLTTTCVTGGPL